MGSAVLPIDGPLRLSLVALGVHDGGEVAAHPVELAGVEVSCLLDHDLFATTAGVGRQRQALDGVDDHAGLVGRHLWRRAGRAASSGAPR